MKVKIYQKGFFLAIVGLLFSISAMAQGKKVTGKVTDSKDGSGLPGVSISIKGTTKGAVTDGSGRYSIEVPSDNSVLTFSYIGYSAQDVSVGSKTTVDVALLEDATALGEVVVTGYQEVRQKDITGAVTVVDVESLKAIKGSSIISGLAGRSPGVTVSTSGQPGDATNVRIRGISSFTSNDPLYIVDGIPMNDGYMNALNQEDIESMVVLKDASAASIYGSRASNGVIVITTKKGKAGKTKFNYNGSVGLSSPVKGYDEILNTSSTYYQQVIRQKFASQPGAEPSWVKGAFANKLPKYVHNLSDVADLSTYESQKNGITETDQAGNNWWDAMTRTGKMTDHTISASGGSESTTFYISGSYTKQEGIILNTDFNRGTIRANANTKVGRKFRIGESILFSGNWGTSMGSSGGGSNNEQSIIGNYLKSNPMVPLYDIKGNPAAHYSGTTGNFTNPFTIADQLRNNRNQYLRLLASMNGEYDILTNLTAKTTFAADLGNGFSKRFSYPRPYVSEPNYGNNFNESWNKNFTWTWTNSLNYKKSFDKHAFNVFAGTEAIKGIGRDAYLSLSNYNTEDPNAFYINTALGDPGTRDLNSGGSENGLYSLFSKVDYTYADKYILSATIRRDQSSKFDKEVRTGYFPGGSIGWRISQEPFMKGLTWLSDLKMRVAYGSVGNQAIRDYNFASQYGGSVGSSFYDINGNNSTPITGYRLLSYGNEITQWEANKSFNIGLDGSLINNSLSFVLDVYKRDTDDLLFNPDLPFTAGRASAPFVNVGSMENIGYDLSLTYRKSLTKDLKLNSTLNLMQYKNKVVKVADAQTEFFSGNGGRIPGNTQVNRVGFPLASFYGYKVDGLITNEAEKAAGLAGSVIGGLRFSDIDGDGKITEKDRTIIGNPHPKLTTGLDLGLSYKNFEFNTFILGVFGNDIYNVVKNYSVFTEFSSNSIKDLLEKQSDPTWPKNNSLDIASKNSSAFYVEKGSYVRMANLQLSYNIPTSLAKNVGLGNARVYVQGQNLFTITKYSGVDPAISNARTGQNQDQNDLNMGKDVGNYPSNKILTFGVNLEF